MKYFFDFEFLEHFVKVGVFKTRDVHTIEPIQLGMIAEDGRKLEIFYNDFDLKAVWQHEWLRENVLKPLYSADAGVKTGIRMGFDVKFNYEWFKRFIKAKGVSKKQAARLIKDFCQGLEPDGFLYTGPSRSNPEFYAYFADYDWIAMCQTFGTMMSLPKDFPMYCNDLKQTLEDKAKARNTTSELLKKRKDYPKQEKEHDALDDAKFNFELFNFLNKL